MNVSPARILLTLLLAFPLLADKSAIPANPDEAFFRQDPRILMRLCTDEAKRLARRDLHVHAETGDVYLSLGDRSLAEAQFESLLHQSRRPDGETFRIVGRAWLRHGFKAEALKAYKEMSGTPESNSWDKRKNYLKRAATDLLEGGLPKEAEEFMDASYAADKGDAQNCYEIGVAAMAAGETGLAIRCFQRAFNAEPRDVDPWLAAARAVGDRLRKPVPAAP